MSQWFLVQTKPKQEVRAQENLEHRGLKAFCPQILVEKIYKGQRKISREVLFPNYLFVNFDQALVSTVSVNHTRGVRKLVSFGNYPAQIPERLIEQLKARVDHNNHSPISSLPEQGDRLQILEGPFRGLNAIFSQIDGDSRALVLITILSQKVKAVLPLSSLNYSKKSTVKVV